MQADRQAGWQVSIEASGHGVGMGKGQAQQQ